MLQREDQEAIQLLEVASLAITKFKVSINILTFTLEDLRPSYAQLADRASRAHVRSIHSSDMGRWIFPRGHVRSLSSSPGRSVAHWGFGSFPLSHWSAIQSPVLLVRLLLCAVFGGHDRPDRMF